MSEAYERVHRICSREIARREQPKERMLMYQEEMKRPRPVPNNRTIYTGPRGGQYYMSPRGKQYLSRR